MGNYQGYQKYKDSGVEWLGEIPEHWEVIRIKFSTYVKGRVGWHGLNSKEFLYEGDFYLVTGTDFKNRTVNWESCYRITEERYEEDPYIHLQEKDILITKDGTIGKVVQVKNIPYKASVNSGVFVTRPLKNKHYKDDYMFYVLASNIFHEFINLQKSGTTISHLYQNVFENFQYPFPPLDEQEKIAQFLDYKTKQIDELIKKKETLIEKLDEKRTAIISHAVTKGLDSSVPIKDSGVEWLGDIPEHWEVIKVKHLTKILRGKFTHRPRNDPRFYDGQHPFIQTGDVANANKFIMEYTQTLNENGYAVSKEFPSGTLVMTIAANIGDMAILNFNACFPDSIVGFLPSKMTDIFFLYHLFSSMKKQFLSTAVLNTQLNLNVERISNIFTVIPPLKEQLQITDFLNKEMQKLDLQKAKIKEAIELLKEYRTSLITNAVTGKIDVSQIAVP
jgi:type I restriction enzyme S subunit